MTSSSESSSSRMSSFSSSLRIFLYNSAALLDARLGGIRGFASTSHSPDVLLEIILLLPFPFPFPFPLLSDIPFSLNFYEIKGKNIYLFHISLKIVCRQMSI